MSENIEEENADEILKEFIEDSNINEAEKKELLSINLRAIFDPLSHHYKQTPEADRVRWYKAIIMSDIYFGSFMENLVVWLESVSMGIAVLNIGEAIQENTKKMMA